MKFLLNFFKKNFQRRAAQEPFAPYTKHPEEAFSQALYELKKVSYDTAKERIGQYYGPDYLHVNVRTGNQKPSVFISYAQEAEVTQWIDRVLKVHLSENLGLKVFFDQTNMKPGTQFSDFESRIQETGVSFVLVVATPLYYQKCLAFDEKGQRSGVSDEMGFIRNRLSQSHLRGTIIPTLVKGSFETSLPRDFKQTFCSDLRHPTLNPEETTANTYYKGFFDITRTLYCISDKRYHQHLRPIRDNFFESMDKQLPTKPVLSLT